MGKPISAVGNKTTGHSTYKPRAAIGGSTNVFVNGLGVNCIGDLWAPHGAAPAFRGDPHPAESTHVTTSGSTTVFVNDKGVARIGDLVELDTIAAGSPDVFAG
jgi:uncharacterized Zn-binding protein involved in type VI secretion